MRQIAFDLQRGQQQAGAEQRRCFIMQMPKCCRNLEKSEAFAWHSVCVCVLKQFPSAVQKTDNKLSKLNFGSNNVIDCTCIGNCPTLQQVTLNIVE